MSHLWVIYSSHECELWYDWRLQFVGHALPTVYSVNYTGGVSLRWISRHMIKVQCQYKSLWGSKVLDICGTGDDMTFAKGNQVALICCAVYFTMRSDIISRCCATQTEANISTGNWKDRIKISLHVPREIEFLHLNLGDFMFLCFLCKYCLRIIIINHHCKLCIFESQSWAQ